jgi:hypothetical protein
VATRWLDLPVWICSSVLSLIFALVGSLWIYKLSTPDALLAAVLDILDLCSSFLAVLLDLNPWHFATLRRFCNPSSGGWKLSSHLDTHNVFDNDMGWPDLLVSDAMVMMAADDYRG